MIETLYFYTGLFFIVDPYFFLTYGFFGVGAVKWGFGIGVSSLWGLGFVVRGFLGFCCLFGSVDINIEE